MDLCQIHTKYSLGHGLNPNTMSPSIDRDPCMFFSLISTGLGPKGQGCNMTYAADMVAVVWGYTTDSCTIEYNVFQLNITGFC